MKYFIAGHVALLLKSYIVSTSSTQYLSAGTYTADAAKEGLTTQQVEDALGLSLGRQVMLLIAVIIERNIPFLLITDALFN